MKFIEAKSEKDFALPGVEIEFDKIVNQLHRVSFRVNGKLIGVIEKHNWNDIHVVIPEPPKMVKKYRVTGKTGSFDVSKDFDDKKDAEREAEGLNEGYTITEVEVPAEE
jgi:hypothetical protein